MSKPTLYLMLGNPGAGKTFTAEIIEQLTGATRLTSDQIRLDMFPQPTFSEPEHQKLYKEIDRRTEELLSKGESVIYDANLNRYIHRKQKYDICSRTGAKPVLVWLNTKQSLAKIRSTELSDTDPKRRPFGNLEVSDFDRLASKIEQPRPDENSIEIVGENITAEKVKLALNLRKDD